MIKKKILILISTVIGTTVAGLTFVVANGIGNSSIKPLAAGTKINGSFTFTRAGNFVSKTNNTIVCRAANDRGTELFFISDNYYPSSDVIAAFGYTSYAQQSFSFFKDAGRAEAFTFQNVTSISVGLKSTSSNAPTYKIYTDSALTEANAVEGSLTKGAVTEITAVAGATFIKFVPTSSAFMDITSVTINYSCDLEG